MKVESDSLGGKITIEISGKVGEIPWRYVFYLESMFVDFFYDYVLLDSF